MRPDNRCRHPFRRILRIERLAARQLLAADLQNPLVPEDVNDDGAITAGDALRVINLLNLQDATPDALLTYGDVNGDGKVTAGDALSIINVLSTRSASKSIETSIESTSIRGNVELNSGPLVIAKAKIGKGSTFDVLVDANGNFAIDVSSHADEFKGTPQATLYFLAADGTFALRQVTLALPEAAPLDVMRYESDSGLVALFADGLLSVHGTETDDQILISEFDDVLAIDGISESFPLAEIQYLAVFAYGGGDSIEIAGSSIQRDIRVLVDGGVGNDFITSSLGINTIGGGEGDDFVWGGSQSDYIVGGPGNDILHGDAGDDFLSGSDGDDQIYGDEGIDQIEGDDGNDLLDGGDDDDVISGGNGADRIWGGAGIDLLDGGGDDDEIWGGEGADLIYGGLGHDSLHGNEGDDLISGGDGRDSIFGNSGNDWLNGGASGDFIYGGAGDDVLEGEAGKDDLSGEEGHDRISGGSGPDRIWGGEGDDELRGGEDDDVLRGGDGNDIIDGDAGDDRLYGDNGNDDLYGLVVGGELLGGDFSDGGPGDDERHYDNIVRDIVSIWLIGQSFSVPTGSSVASPIDSSQPAVMPGFTQVFGSSFDSQQRVFDLLDNFDMQNAGALSLVSPDALQNNMRIMLSGYNQGKFESKLRNPDAIGGRDQSHAVFSSLSQGVAGYHPLYT